MKKRVTLRWRNWEAQSCKQVVLCVCDCQRGAVINKLCDSSYRRHLLWHARTHTHAHTCCSDDHSFPWGYESPGRTCVRLQHPSCFPLLSLSTFFSPPSSSASTCAQSGVCLTCLFIFTPLPLLTLFLLVSLLLPSAFHSPPPPGLPFSQWQIYSESDAQWKAYGDRCVQGGSQRCHIAWWSD